MHEKERELLRQQEVTLVDAGQFEQRGMVTALKLPNGSLLMNTSYRHESRASGATLSLYMKFLGATQVVVHGKWVFVPDILEEETGEVSNAESSSSS